MLNKIIPKSIRKKLRVANEEQFHKKKQSKFFDDKKITKELFEKIINRFEKWRIAFNNGQAGFGIDPYFTAEMLHYPMAYAFYIRGFCEMYKFSNDKKWLEKAIITSDLLNKIRIGKKYAWGLPFAWKDRADEPYLITTAFVGHSFLDLFEITQNKKYLAYVDKIIRWVIEDLGFYENKTGICFWFSPRLSEPVLNASTETLGVFSRYLNLSEKENPILYDLIVRGISYTKSRKLPTKDWGYYGEKKSRVELRDFHRNYIVEANHYLSLDENNFDLSIKLDVIKPYISIAQSVMNDNGSLDISTTDKIEARLWAYGTYLYTGAMILKRAEEFENKIAEIVFTLVNYIMSNLWDNEKGAFYFRCNDYETRYIRHEAHIFYGITKLLNCTRFWKNMRKIK